MAANQPNVGNDDKKGFKKAFESLNTALGDLSSLEVQTYVGKIELPDTEDGGKKLDVTKFEDYLKGCVAKPNDLKLVAVTKMNFDGDAINLVPEEGFPDHVQKVHEAAVRAGIETRHGLLSLFGSLIGVKEKG